MSLAVTYLEGLDVVQISHQGQSVLIRRDQSADLLAKFMAVLAETVPGGFDIDETPMPGLRLVGAFGCDPDESCGQAS